MKTFKFFSTARSWLLMFMAALAIAEGSVRALGLVDFPLYDANAQIGYIPAANQQGSFLNKNDWQFNALHMGAPAFAPDPARDVLLVGDSLVYGGNTYRQPERLGPALQTLLQERGGGQVWPISAGSWALRNELAYMRLKTPAGAWAGTKTEFTPQLRALACWRPSSATIWIGLSEWAGFELR